MGTPTYDQIRKLATQLQQETKVKARREIGEKLHGLLSKEDVRRRLAMEATPARTRPDDDSVAATRCRALSQLWTVIIHGAISVAQSNGTGKSKSKRTLEDVTLPKRLLVCCDKPDEAFDNDGLGIPKLNRKTVRNILKYCLSMLEDEDATALAEIELLDMLNHMCSRVEYVGYFKYHSDFSNILDELSHRLTSEVEEENQNSFFHAAKAFDSLFGTCKNLGIQMHFYLSDSMEIISAWCKGHIHGNTVKPTSNVLPHFYSAMASFLYSHPEHAIGPMKRHGRPILSYCKRCYPSAAGVNKDALNNYLLAHL
jgi:hypothetical protein